MAFLIQRWKFHGDRYLTRLLAELWLEALPTHTKVDCLVPMPLHWRREWSRGFNQSDLLARALLDLRPNLGRLAPRLLRRTKHTTAQSGISATARRLNLRSAFTVRGACDNLHIALIDDVMTTGATATAAASLLRKAGARRVDIWSLARTPR